MIVIEIPSWGRVTLHNCHISVTGEKSEELARFAQDAVNLAGCSPGNGDPDFNVARLLIEELGGIIVKHEPITVPEEKSENEGSEKTCDNFHIEITIKEEADFDFFDDVIKNL